MPANYVLLEKISVGAVNSGSVTFSGIPQSGYTDLVVKMSSRTSRSAGNEDIYLEFNGSGGTAYSSRRVYATSSGVASDSSSSVAFIEFYSTDGNTATASTFGSAEIYIPNYTSANYKSVSIDAISENNSTAAIEGMTAGLWSNTAAITSIKLTPASGGSFIQYSTFYLYGVAKLGTTPAIVPYATGGDTIMTDGTYWYHAFVSSGTFTPAKGLSCDVVVVAGAGGGGGYCGGGGAGGVAYQTSRSVSSAATVTVGAGGAGGTGNGNGSNGSNSVFDTITANGGGFGAGLSSNGAAGGSAGGGSNGTSGGTANQGSSGGATGYGFNGGSGLNAPTMGGGGGGAGAVGVNAVGTVAGNGGAGLNTWSTWLSATGLGASGYVAGGGGGGRDNTGTDGSGGAGGGGKGGTTSGFVAGTANTGGGGGGGQGTGGAGGSGLVIVRYAV